MAKSPTFYWPCVFFLLISASAGQEIITATPGQNVTLPCRAPNSKHLSGVEWRRQDLKSEYVLLYRDEQFDPEDQHPSFENRVDLQDRQMKDGDLSLILKNVTTADNGTYMCRALTPGRKRGKRASETVKIITLSVVAPPGPSGTLTEDGGKDDEISRGHLGIIIPLSFMAFVAAILITVKKKNSSLTLPSDKESEQMQV